MPTPTRTLRPLLEHAVDRARRAGLDDESIARVMLAEAISLLRGSQSAAEVRAFLEFEVTHLADDEDFPFMRP